MTQHLCLDWNCPTCHPARSVVDNPVDNPTPEDGGGVVEPTWTQHWEESLYPLEQIHGPLYYALFLETKLRQARDLIMWFSRKWGDDLDPLFPWRDEYTQSDLPGNVALSRTWYEIVRDGAPCEACEGTRGKRVATDQDRVFTFEPCVECGGRGFLPRHEI